MSIAVRPWQAAVKTLRFGLASGQAGPSWHLHDPSRSRSRRGLHRGLHRGLRSTWVVDRQRTRTDQSSCGADWRASRGRQVTHLGASRHVERQLPGRTETSQRKCEKGLAPVVASPYGCDRGRTLLKRPQSNHASGRRSRLGGSARKESLSMPSCPGVLAAPSACRGGADGKRG